MVYCMLYYNIINWKRISKRKIPVVIVNKYEYYYENNCEKHN